MASEIQEENEQGIVLIVNRGAQKERIRRIIEYQKSLYRCSLSAAPSACSSFSSSGQSVSLLNLMKNGSTSLRRLFDMEHISLRTYFEHYSGSPMVKSIPLWGSDIDDEQVHDPWAFVRQTGICRDVGVDGMSRFASEGSFMVGELGLQDRKKVQRRIPTLTRKRSFRILPGFRVWRFKRLRFSLRFFKRLRVMICDDTVIQDKSADETSSFSSESVNSVSPAD